MANLGGIPFADRSWEHDSAVAVRLSSPARASVVQRMAGAEGELRPGCDYVVVRFKGACDADSARSEGLELAQRFLDLISVLGSADLATTKATEESFVSWRTDGQQRIQLLSTTTWSFDNSPVAFVVRDAQGKEVEPKDPRPEYHPAFRYFRLSQVSDDLHEAFRNMYLALELLLSSKHPQRKREGERAWLRRALQVTHEELDLTRFEKHSEGEVVDVLMRRIYTDTRLPLFHAKSDRPVLTPQASGEERAVVVGALELLTPIVLEMCQRWYHARRMGGGVFHAWVYGRLRSMFESARILVMDDPNPPRPDQRDLEDPRYKLAVGCHTEVREDPLDARVPVLWGEVEVDSLWKGQLTKIEVVGPSAPMLAHPLETPLTLDGFDVFEYCDRPAIRNVRQPRRFYDR